MNELIRGAVTLTKPDPRFAYLAPHFIQAKDIAWSYLKRFTAPIPGVGTNESELRVDLLNGGRIRLYGAENFHRLRGLYFDGVVCDEFGDMDPRAWKEVIRPTLSDRRGWAIFIGTPRGQNHFFELWEHARTDSDWFTLMLRASQTGLISPEELADARKSMSDEQYAAEYEASFEASVAGSFWGKQMADAEREGRITRVAYQPEIGCETWWDLGVDNMAVWITQTVGREVHVIDYLEGEGAGLPAYAKALNERGYVYISHNAPHDAWGREIGSGKSRVEMAQSLGIRFSRVPDVGLGDGIDQARAFIARCWFDREHTELGRRALVSYRKEWDEKRKMFHQRPHVDWSNHAADAFRYLSVGHKIAQQFRKQASRPTTLQQSPTHGWMGS